MIITIVCVLVLAFAYAMHRWDVEMEKQDKEWYRLQAIKHEARMQRIKADHKKRKCKGCCPGG